MTILDEGRYDRQERIRWWDQQLLAGSRILVVGAGALGNEIVKNLALVGVGSIDVVDMDRIEHSNLARCALFRDGDEGRFKAEVLAEAARRVNPEINVRSFVGTVQTLGDALLRNYSLVIAGLDNREARLWINTACRKLGLTWIDGAIEGLQGLVRVFPPSGACYECTLTPADFAALSHRRSCALLAPEELSTGKTPTNATTASIVAAIQVQEAIKILVQRPDLTALAGRVWRMEGETMLTSVVAYTEDPDCMAHDSWDVSVDAADGAATLLDVAEQLRPRHGATHTFYFSDDFIVIEACAQGCPGDDVRGLRSVLPAGVARCETCGEERPMTSRTAIEATDPLAASDRTDWLWPREQFVTAMTDQGPIHVALRGTDD
jgi:molybdopterin/thiamine biosynthesis adenylyltransferase